MFVKFFTLLKKRPPSFQNEIHVAVADKNYFVLSQLAEAASRREPDTMKRHDCNLTIAAALANDPIYLPQALSLFIHTFVQTDETTAQHHAALQGLMANADKALCSEMRTNCYRTVMAHTHEDTPVHAEASKNIATPLSPSRPMRIMSALLLDAPSRR